MKKNNKIIHIIYWLFILLVTFNMVKNQVKLDNNINNIILLFIENFFCSIYKFYLLTLTYVIFLSYCIVYKKVNKIKFDYSDSDNEHYYRDILEDYSPLEIGFIDNFKIEKNDVIATILNLHLKGNIDLNTFTIKSLDNLKKHEEILINCIKNKKIVLNDFNKIIINECLNRKLIYDLANRKYVKWYIFILILFGIFLKILAFMFNNIILILNLSEYLYNILNFYFLVLPVFILFSILFFSAILGDKIINGGFYVRTSKAKEINYKIKGLKKFISDFSNLNSRKLNEVKLWREYLVYSVMCGNNEDIIKQIEKKISIVEYY